MELEKRIIKASIATGITDLIIGLIAFQTGFGDWYYLRFHNFGIFGLSMITYGLYHFLFEKLDKR